MPTFMNDTLSKDLAERLSQTLPLLSDRDKDFASSLIAAQKRYGRVTEKQADFMETLIRRPDEPKPVRTVVDIGDMRSVVELFDAAMARGLKFPSVVLRDETEGDVKLYRTRGGPISVQTNDGYPASKWFGKIDTAGKFELSYKHRPPASLLRLLERFALEPAATAAEHGRLTGLCCLCHRPLKDSRSTEVGYGPVCAKKWGFAWG